MKGGLFKVTIGRITVACFAADPKEAIERACDDINERYPDAMIDPDTVFFDVSRISAVDLDFNDEVL